MTTRPTILLLEDDDDLRRAYRLVLSARGLEPREAGTAREALEILEEEAPDVVVADLGLPDSDGPELLRSLRDAAPETRLLVLTGEASRETARRCRRLGADRVLVKPVDASDLEAAIRGDG